MLKKVLLKYILICLFCSSFVAVGQNEQIGKYIISDTSLSNIYYYYSNKDSYLIDSLYNVYYDAFEVHYYTPLMYPNNHFYQQLSTSGSSCKDMIYHPISIFDYKRSPNLFTPYSMNKHNTKYFQNKKAYTSIAYSGSTLGNQFFRVNFAQNLYKGLNLQTEYFVNYSDGDFDKSQVMNQFFNFSLNYISPKGNYRNNLSFDHNRAYILENGGIISDSAFRNHDYSSPSSFPINLQQGWSKWKTSEYSFNQTLRLDKDTSQTVKIFNKGALVHNSSFFRAARLYKDENHLSKDSLGENLWQNSIFWTNDIYNTKDRFFIPISIGLNMDFLNFNDSLSSKWFSLIAPQIKIGIKNNDFQVFASASRIFSSSDYNKDFEIKTSARYDINKEQNFYLFADFLMQERQPYYIFTHFFNENYSWDNTSLSKTQTSSFCGGISFNDHFIVKARYLSLKNMYAFNTDLQMLCSNNKIFQVFFNHNILIGRLRLSGSYIFQKSSQDIVHLPALAIKQSFAYNFTIFKGKLNLQSGLDLYYYTKFKADNYNPEIGIFTLQDKENIGNYPYADIFLSLNIKQFCMFVMLEHPYSGIFSYDYFNTPLYPSERFQLRYGLTWKLIN